MRSLWRGAIAFGLVHIPVKVYAATEDRDVSFRQLHLRCHTPIRYQKYCPACDVVVDNDQIVRGYEYQSGQFVVIDDETLENIPEGREKTVEVLHFVNLHDIDPVYFNRSYYLEPDAGGGRAYKLLQETMLNRGRIAISRVVLRTRPRLAAVRVGPEGILTLETLHYPDEIRSPQALLDSWAESAVEEPELEMALQLVDQRSRQFVPTAYQDDYREALLAHIEAQLADPQRRVTPEQQPPTEHVIDLMEALRASLQAEDPATFPAEHNGSAPTSNGRGAHGKKTRPTRQPAAKS